MKMGLGGGSPVPDTNPKPGKGQSMPEKTASWPGLPGKGQPSGRNNGVPMTGHCGPFYVKKDGV